MLVQKCTIVFFSLFLLFPFLAVLLCTPVLVCSHVCHNSVDSNSHIYWHLAHGYQYNYVIVFKIVLEQSITILRKHTYTINLLCVNNISYCQPLTCLVMVVIFSIAIHIGRWWLSSSVSGGSSFSTWGAQKNKKYELTIHWLQSSHRTRLVCRGRVLDGVFPLP